MSIDKTKKANIIYTRLYKEYGNWRTWVEFAKENFGITRQQMHTRRNTGILDLDELRRVFPNVNEEWITSNTYEGLNELPVKTTGSVQRNSGVDTRIERIKREIAQIERDAGDPHNLQKKQDVLIEFLLNHVKSLSDVLQNLVELKQKE